MKKKLTFSLSICGAIVAVLLSNSTSERPEQAANISADVSKAALPSSTSPHIASLPAHDCALDHEHHSHTATSLASFPAASYKDLLEQSYQKGDEFTLEIGQHSNTAIVNLYKDSASGASIGGELREGGTFALNKVGDKYYGFVSISADNGGDNIIYQLEKDKHGQEIWKNIALDSFACRGIKISAIVLDNSIQEAAAPGDDIQNVEVALEIPLLNSRPNAEAVFYIDCRGGNLDNTWWNGAKTIPLTAWGTAGEITKVWKIIKEDFLPFNVNVTTDSTVFYAADINMRQRCILSNYSDWYPSAGGVAKVYSFKSDLDIPCFVFADRYGSNTTGEADAASHEFGHTVGLLHHGVSGGSGGSGYYGGHGSGSTSWAPIMGSSYSRSFVQWSKGEYNNANNHQDDLSIISSALTYSNDDHGSDFNNSSEINTVADIAATGIIEKNNDSDF
ncbi:MAG: hypothetical protein HRT88_22235, partial [Lentisphaeraceae bacterium]|nr:hypothetical protein [Lentisphaeraceae bacterium]